MSNFRIFETAYKKALSNNRRPRDAVQCALNKFIAHMIEELHFRADAETRECFADEAFEIYCDARNDHDTHGAAAHAATKYIERELKDAESGHECHSGGRSSWSRDESRGSGSGFRSYSSRDESRSGGSGFRSWSSQGQSRGSRSNSSSQGKESFGTRGKPVYNYNDPRNNDTASSARSKPAYNYDDPRNVRPSPITRSKTAYSSENPYDSYSEPRGASEQGSFGCRKDRGSRSQGKLLYDFEDMFDALPKDGRGSGHCRKDRGYSRSDTYDSHYNGSDHCRKDRGYSRSASYDSHYDGSDHCRKDRGHSRHGFYNHSDSHHGHPGRQQPPMPAGFGRFKFPTPNFTKGSSTAYSFFSTHESRPTDHGRHNTREFRPSYHGEHDTRESRPNDGGHNTREFKPSWYGGDNSGSPRPSEYGYAYTSDSRAPPRNSHNSSRGPSPSSHNTRSNPPPTSESVDIKPTTCYYTVLGVSRTSTSDHIRAAYRKMSMKHHPDRIAGADKEKATAKMAEINQANDVLSDVVKRQYYDRTGCVPGLN